MGKKEIEEINRFVVYMEMKEIILDIMENKNGREIWKKGLIDVLMMRREVELEIKFMVRMRGRMKMEEKEIEGIKEEYKNKGYMGIKMQMIELGQGVMEEKKIEIIIKV